MAQTPKNKRVAEAMAADKVWDKAHGIKQGSPADQKRDAMVKRNAMRSK